MVGRRKASVTQCGLDAVGEAVFEQCRAENGDDPLAMPRRHARGGDEDAGELVDAVALRQARRRKVEKVVAEQVIDGRGQQPQTAIDLALARQADQIDRVGIVVAVPLESVFGTQRSPFSAHDVDLVAKSKEVLEDRWIGSSFNAHK
jgi:hypothetical protein